MRISDWSSDVCSSDLETEGLSTSRLAADDDHLRREEFGMSIGSLFSRPAKLALVVGVSLASVAGIVHAQSATSALGIASAIRGDVRYTNNRVTKAAKMENGRAACREEVSPYI